ncbi:hypothetical protein ACHQM5_024312 [Ranunculus cassubicifolius]
MISREQETKEKLDYQCREQPSFFKERSRRSHSTPPFYKGKGKFSTIYNCVNIEADREPSSPRSQVTGDFKHSFQFCSVSQPPLEQSPAIDSPRSSRTPIK